MVHLSSEAEVDPGRTSVGAGPAGARGCAGVGLGRGLAGWLGRPSLAESFFFKHFSSKTKINAK